MSEIDQLVTAVLAFLDTDTVWGSEHPRTRTAKALLQRVASATLREANAVDIEPCALDGTAA